MQGGRIRARNSAPPHGPVCRGPHVPGRLISVFAGDGTVGSGEDDERDAGRDRHGSRDAEDGYPG
ncbi:hypothetical protein GCM10010513_58890 [Streptomyces glebosus]|nr:hypothetical protein GCM10010513_58890 [Streptomyces glebosus]